VDTQTQTPDLPPENDEDVDPNTLLLDFGSPTERAIGVAPNGEAYEVRALEEFGIAEDHELRRQRARFTVLNERLKKKLTSAEAAELEHLLATLFDKVVVASDEAKKEFKDRQKQKVVMFFTVAQLGEEAAMSRAAHKLIAPPDDSTTEN